MEDSSYSALMCVSPHETPAYLKDSMMSLFEQTVQSDDFVLIENGPLPPALKAVIKRLKTVFKNRLRVITLRGHVERGDALAIGLKECRHEIVARMNSDAIAVPERCERQLRVFDKRTVDIVGCAVSVFKDEPENVTKVLYLPTEAVDITKYSRRLAPFHDTAVMMKKSKALMAGNFNGEFQPYEDYHLWVRMLMNGCSGFNIAEALVAVREESLTERDRSGADQLLSFQKWKREVGWMKMSDYVKARVRLLLP